MATIGYDGTDFFPHTEVCDWCMGDGKGRALHPSLREGLAAMLKIIKPVPLEEEEPDPRFEWNVDCFWCGGTGKRKVYG